MSWPAIPVAEWRDTRDTLHLYTQVVGKVRMANEPLSNHWWNTALYVSATGLTTSLMPHPTGSAFQIDFDFVDHRLEARTIDGDARSLALAARPVADFYRDVLNMLDGLGVGTEIWPMPVEIEGAIAFPDDRVHASYDADCGPHVMREAYSHEVSSCGYWPGEPGEEGVFYSYAYPDPPGYRDTPVAPDEARWNDDLGEFVLPYEVVRTSADPDGVLLEFLQSTYEAAATSAEWDRPALERSGEGPHRG